LERVQPTLRTQQGFKLSDEICGIKLMPGKRSALQSVVLSDTTPYNLNAIAYGFF
jgi:hypothetical protein